MADPSLPAEPFPSDRTTQPGGTAADVMALPVRLPDGSEVTGRWLLPGSWRPLPDGRAQLLAARCPRCAALTFPATGICPRCWNTGTLRAEAVPEPGRVYAVTTVRAGEPGIAAPYRIGYADFAGGLRICGRFAGPQTDVGDPVEIIVAVLRQQPADPLVGWAFRKTEA